MSVRATSATQDALDGYYLEIRGKVSQQPIGSITVDTQTGEWLLWPQGAHSHRRCKRIGQAIMDLVAIEREVKQ